MTTEEPIIKPKWYQKINIFQILLFVWLAVLARDLIHFQNNVQEISYSEFLNDVSLGKVEHVVLSGNKVEGQFKEGLKDDPKDAPKVVSKEAPKDLSKNGANSRKGFLALRVEDPTLLERLIKAQVKFEANPNDGGGWRQVMSWIIPILLIWGILTFFMRRFTSMRTDFLSVGKSKARIYVEKGIPIRFEDVAGVDEVKEELMEVVNFLKDPKGYSKLGGRMPKGILLVGPPGTGKTLLARAVAGEAHVAFFSINGSEFVEMFVGVGAARVRDLFEQARAQSPCIIFIDELDALGRARAIASANGSSNDEKEQTLNQLLAELDGFDTSKGVILLGATNRPEVLDPALLRSGRFDRQILVDKPDRKARNEILAVHLKKIIVEPGVNRENLAFLTSGFSGADLANLVNEAALIATRRGETAVFDHDFTEAIERIMAGLERRSRILGPEEKKRVSYHEMGHAVVALALGRDETVHKVSIIPRGMGALGYTFRRQTEDRYLMGKQELENKIAMLLGGRGSEMLFFPDISTGAADDLDKATELSRAMVTRYGMSLELGPVSLEREYSPFLGGEPLQRGLSYSQQTAQMIDKDIRRQIEASLSVAVKCIEKYQLFVHECVEKLMIQEILEETELKQIWEKHRNPLRISVVPQLDNTHS